MFVNLGVCYWNILIIDVGFEVLTALPSVLPKCWLIFSGLHSVISQKIKLLINK
jgi:hypothetical protein